MSNQKPINSPFNKRSTSRKIMSRVNLAGKNIIITGGYSGIGLETTKALYRAGANIIIPARNTEKAKKALKNMNVSIQYMDIMKIDSIDSFAEDYLKNGKSLDILIESAGIMFPPLERDERGNESQFSTNYLGHFQLVKKLYPALKRTKNARVVILTSRAQSWNGVNFDDPNYHLRDYDPREAYAQSKVADILFAYELDKRAKSDDIRAYAVHPGLVPGTGLGRFALNNKFASSTISFLLNQLHLTTLINFRNYISSKLKHESEYDYFKTVQQGAASTLWASTSELLSGHGGVFIEDSNIGIAVESHSTSKFGVRPWSIDPVLSERLWQLGEEYTGSSFEI